MLTGFDLIVMETLPSWPSVTEPTLMQILLVTLFIPGIIAAVITALSMGPSWLRREQTPAAEPVQRQLNP